MNTIPSETELREPDASHKEDAAPFAETLGVGPLRSEYTSEEVSEIIRVALQSADGTRVKQEELLAIGQEFGLSEAKCKSRCGCR